MKQKWPDEVMEERRRERLLHVRFFMRPELPESMRYVMARGACLDLLTGWFQNSKWRTCLFVLRAALRDSWETSKLDVQLFWHHRVMRRSREETARRVFGDEPDVDEAERDEEWPEEVSL